MFEIQNTHTGAVVGCPDWVTTRRQAVEYAGAVLAAFVGNVTVRAAADHRSFIAIRSDSQAEQRFIVYSVA